MFNLSMLYYTNFHHRFVICNITAQRAIVGIDPTRISISHIATVSRWPRNKTNESLQYHRTKPALHRITTQSARGLSLLVRGPSFCPLLLTAGEWQR
jgi:hypothetical protein